MKKRLLPAVLVGLLIALTGCGGGGSSPPPPTFTASILSDPVYDGDIEQTASNSFVITQGMTPAVQSVWAGIDPVTRTETRAFLDFYIRGSGGVPYNAIISSAFLDLFINSFHSNSGSIPIRIELVAFQPPTLVSSDFSRILQPSISFTTIVPPIAPADVGQNVIVDVTPLMVAAQNQGLTDFQVRILEDLGTPPPGLIEISDTTGTNRSTRAPLLEVTYF